MKEYIRITGYIGTISTGQHDGQPYIRFTVGAKSEFAAKTHWYSVMLWGTRMVKTYTNKARKGDLVTVSGTPEIRTYMKDNEKRVSVAVRIDRSDNFKIIRRVGDRAE